MVRALALVAGLFGLLTIMSGGQALFGGAEARAAVGAYVPFVLWFNFVAGFAYLVAAYGMGRGRAWARGLAGAIPAATLAVFVLFGIAVALGVPFEARTVGAMILRSTFWLAVTALLWRNAPVPTS